VYFAVEELRKRLHNVVASPNDRNFRCIDVRSVSYKRRMASVPAVSAILTDFGFVPQAAVKLAKDGREKKTVVFLEAVDPHLEKFECGVMDCMRVLRRLLPHTIIHRALGKLYRDNVNADLGGKLDVGGGIWGDARLGDGQPGVSPREFAAIMKRWTAAVENILSVPHEDKYRRINSAKLFKPASKGVLRNGLKFLGLFGFVQEERESPFVVLGYPFDENLLATRLRLCQSVFKQLDTTQD
jgi:hypothetical protein